MEKFLNDAEELEIQRFITNPTMVGAVKKVLLSDVYYSGILPAGVDPDFTRNFAFSLLFDPYTGAEYGIDNEKLGSKLRACLEGIRMVQTGFNRLDKYKPQETNEKPQVNEAR